LAAVRPFLTAEWRHLVMLSWACDPALLARFVPAGTALELWNGTAFLSLVGFRFVGTRVLGVPVPLHRDFDEVNLRCYVRREVGGEVRRGVVFVREFVPRRAIAALARLVYNEPYDAAPMTSRVAPAGAPDVAYRWQWAGAWHRVAARASGAPAVPAPGSLDAFIVEHYWGYTRQRDGGTVEYHVMHPPWRLWPVTDWSLEADVARLYGAPFAAVVKGTPHCALIAEGSAVTVYRPERIPASADGAAAGAAA